MLYSIAASIASYYVLLFCVGVLVNTVAIEGSLIALAVICFVGAYYARHSRFVYRMANTIGTVAVGLLLASWVLLPILQGSKTWFVIISVFVGVAVYIYSRRIIHRRWLRRDQETGDYIVTSPFGREWCRWLVAFLL